MKNPFDRLFSLSEAAQTWGVDESTLRHAIRDGRIHEGDEVRKFGKQWVITQDAMERRYGPLPTVPGDPDTMVEVEVELPEWLYNMAMGAGLDLSAILQEALSVRLKVHNR